MKASDLAAIYALLKSIADGDQKTPGAEGQLRADAFWYSVVIKQALDGINIEIVGGDK